MKKKAITTGIACFLVAASANAQNIGDLHEGSASNTQSVAAGVAVHPLTLAKRFQLAGALLFKLDQNTIYDLRYGYDPCDESLGEQLRNEIVGQDVKTIFKDDESDEWKAETYEPGQEMDKTLSSICAFRLKMKQYTESRPRFFLGLDHKIADAIPGQVFVIERRVLGYNSD